MQKERQLSSTTPLTVIMILIIFVITLVGNIVYHANDHDVTITVTDKERIEADRADHRDPYYLIYGTDDAGETTVRELLRLIEVGASCFYHHCVGYEYT